MSLGERFWSKVAWGAWPRGVDPSLGPCLMWTGSRTNRGYGRFYVRGQRTRLAHRLAYIEAYGEVPPGLEPDHLCREPLCVNAAHLEAVTHAENMRRADHQAMGSGNRRKTHCPEGHPYDIQWRGRPNRACRTCRNTRRRNARRDRIARLRT